MPAPGAGRAGIILGGARGVWRCMLTLSTKRSRRLRREGAGGNGGGGEG